MGKIHYFHLMFLSQICITEITKIPVLQALLSCSYYLLLLYYCELKTKSSAGGI